MEKYNKEYVQSLIKNYYEDKYEVFEDKGKLIEEIRSTT
jgi:hypothetical protein